VNGREAPQPALVPGQQLVQAYGPGSFTVAGVRHQGSVLVFPDRTLPWTPATPADITLESLAELQPAAAAIDILLVGTGAKFAMVPPALRQAVRAWGPVVEPMATPSACRTYNVLLAEGRRVAAALIALPPSTPSPAEGGRGPG
jgi:uncharacterized protein